jgi:GT2 family glycosyltransferase
MSSNLMQHQHPFFSIIIPTFERPSSLATCLDAIAALEYPSDRFEVIVVDDGGQTPLSPVVDPFRDALKISLITQSHAGPATARNTGAAHAKGEFLAFTADDCTPAPDWLNGLATRFAKTPDCAIGGQTINVLKKNLYSTASQLLIAYLYAYYGESRDVGAFFTPNNLALPTECFHAIGGFDTTFPYAAEDRNFCDRFKQHGYRLIYAPEVEVYHAHALTLRTFWQQHFRYGQGAFLFHQSRTKRGDEPMKVEPLRFYLNMLRYPFSRTVGWHAAQTSALLAMSQMANAAGFFWAK